MLFNCMPVINNLPIAMYLFLPDYHISDGKYVFLSRLGLKFMSAKLWYAEKLKVEFTYWINTSSRNENQMQMEEKKAVDFLSLL